MKRKALMRRVLSGILCAALVFQNTSVTALATQAPSEMLTEISENANEELSTGELSVSESEIKLMTESSAEESLSEDSSLKESSSAVETETQQLEESTTEDLLSAVETETQQLTEPSSTEESSSAESETQSQETSSENDTIAEIKIDEDELHLLAISEDVGLYFDLDTNTIIAQYSKDNNVFNKITDAIKTSQTIITIDTDDTNYTNLKEHLDFKWQSKNADNTYKDMAAGEALNNVGEYRLVISLDQRFGKSQPVSINFEIIKIVLQADTSEFNVKKKSGITVKEIKDELTDVLKIKDSNENKLDWDTYIKSYTITVKEITGTEALADDAVLKKGTDYSAEITAELADEFISGYELKKINTVYLKVYELKETDITITSLVGNNITRVYDGNPISEPVVTSAQEGITPEITAEITVVGETDEATGKDKVLEVPYESLIKTWYDADGTKRETVPVDAGVYYFELKYTDSEGIYDESSAQIKVEIEPKTIVLSPSIAVTEFLVGNTATDVTSNVVYTLINTDDSVFEGWDKNTFFGVSYNNPEKPQSYAPVFSLQMGVTTKPEEGQETVTVWSDVTGEIVTPTGTDEEGTKTEYRLVFSGKKGLFTDNVATDLIDINATYVNSADKNYNIDTTEETIQKLAIAINVKESANAVIDITAMIPEGVETEAVDSDVNVYKKIYDRNSFYADRAAYKKAIVKDENGVEIAKETTDAITYTWYYASFYEYIDEAGNEVCEAVLKDAVETVYNGLPSNAGTYALEVEYTDPEHKFIADKAYLYFEIEKQLIKFVPDKNIAFDVYEGALISSLTNSIPFELQYKFYKYPDNDVTLANEQLIELTELSSEN